MLGKVKIELVKVAKKWLAKARQVVIGFEQRESLIYMSSSEADKLSRINNSNLKELYRSVQKLDQKSIAVNRNRSSKYKYYLCKRLVSIVERSVKVIRRVL